ncbi:hypothetical protein UFOVP1279_68 [uncultured Caudovirales phage]|uniref:VWFA domain containing protein n=1 Tax=uncultured Caudovirales phage TaxID=2100421 RepID=A0A6J5RLL3_9CAUD|nr:hypothetical protein UFOVP1279_68 [uncultured Caudovirales phage]
MTITSQREAQATSTIQRIESLLHQADDSRAVEAHGLAWAAVLQRVVHLLTGQTSTTVQFIHLGSGPAATDGTTIFLNRNLLQQQRYGPKTTDQQRAITLKGCVYHELGHILYSPGSQGHLRRSFWKEPEQNYILQNVWNILEDGRMETIFSQRFPRAASYFSQIVCEYILNPGHIDNVGTALLVTGRRYLPVALREAAERNIVNLVGETVAAELRSLVTTFHRTPNSRPAEQLAVIKAVAAIIVGADGDVTNEAPVGDGQHNQEEDGSESEAVVDEPSDEDESSEAGPEGTPCPDGEEAEDGEDSTEGAGGDGEEADAEGAEGEGAEGEAEGADGADSQADGEEADAAGGDADEQEGEAEGTRDTTAHGSGGASKSLREAAREELADDQADLNADVSEILGAVEAETQSGSGASAQSPDARDEPVTNDFNLVKGQVGKALAALRNDTAEVLERRQRSGRLDTRRFLDPHRQNHEVDLFQRPAKGEGLNTELVVLLDISGSMDRSISDTAAALWALVSAAEAEGIVSTVLTFNSSGDWSLWKGADDRWDSTVVRVPKVTGCTDPAEPLVWSVRHLSESTCDRQLLVTLTDGSWHGDEATYVAIHAKAIKEGIHTAVLSIGGYDIERYGDHHGAELVKSVPDVMGLPLVIQRWIDGIARS